MRGLTMDYQLTLHYILNRGCGLFANQEIVTRLPGGAVRRRTYTEVHQRTRQLANALASLGVKAGDRVATFGWNHDQHLECYFAAPCMGAVLHTLNIRLAPDHLAFIINHAGDKVIVADQALLPALERVANDVPGVEHVIVMGETGDLAPSQFKSVHSYEKLIGAQSADFVWPTVDENDAAAMCYTSGTTGNPKGVVYSHRAIYLHAMGAAMVDSAGISMTDCVLPVVPMFHANAWGMPFVSMLVGAKQVFPGAMPTPADIAKLIQDEKVTVAAGVPTVWMGVLQAVEQGKFDISSLRCMPCGGSAPPPALMAAYESKFGVPILHAWGMTELAPIGSISTLKPHLRHASPETRFAYQTKQGLPVPGIELKAIDASGADVPWDAKTMGELVAKGPWVASDYYNDPRSADSWTADGWFRTGDIVTIDPDGYIQITDRTKDVIKSGGEWISSVDLENTLMGHPKVAEAAVIAVPHERWQERPLACVVVRPNAGDVTKDELLGFLGDRVAKWWLPDEVVFVPEIPKTTVGKFDKKVLRARHAEGTLA